MMNSRRGRRGLTLLEVLVAVAIMILFSAALMPSLDAVFLLEQRGAARRLALVYEQLHDEAILRNKTYRIAYHLDEGHYEIEVGDPSALIFTNSEAREEFEKREKDRLEDMTPEERQAYKERQDFQKASGGEFEGKIDLPENTVFKSVFTPQYEEPLEPRQRGDRRDDDEGPNVAYSYIFANGFAEYTVIQVVDVEDDDDGFTITVDPMSGRVTFHTELVDHHDAFDFVPDEGPRLPL